MDNLDMELPRKLDAATIAALFPDLDAVRSRVANWLRFLDRVSRDRNFPLYAAALDDEGDDLLREVQQALALLAARYATQEYHSAAERIGQAQQRCSFVFPVFWSGYDVTPVLPAKRQPGGAFSVGEYCNYMNWQDKEWRDLHPQAKARPCPGM